MARAAFPSSSIDSTISALRLIGDDDTHIFGSTTYKFSVSVTFADYQSVGAFCRNYLEKQEESEGVTFWFTWNLFGRTFQTEEFDGLIDNSGNQPQRVKDTIMIRSPSKEAMLAALCADNAMHIALRTQEGSIGSVTVPLGTIVSSSSASGSASGSSSSSSSSSGSGSGSTSSSSSGTVLINETMWHVLKVADGADGAPEAPAVQVITVATIEETPEPTAPLLHPQRSEEPIRQSPDSRRRIDDTTDIHGDTSSEDDDDADDFTRHFRMTIDVRSIGNLTRAAHAAVHFGYPFLGASRPVRTHPLWLPANTEAKLDGAAATFDCIMSRNKIRDIFSEHPLKISALSRTLMGTSNIGDVDVDLFGVLESLPHSYRCPITLKSLKTVAEYKVHRLGMGALRGMGHVDRVPPKDPTTIWASDMYYPLCPDHPHPRAGDSFELGGRLRVVVIVEEIGVVGPEAVQPVKVGYKMHNGALYSSQEALFRTTHTSTTHTRSTSATTQQGRTQGGESISADEQLQLDRLKADWEAFRLKSEAVWRQALRDREQDMRVRVEGEMSKSMAERADDLRRAQEEAGRLEVRLRGALDEVERQKNSMKAKDDQVQVRLAQKTAELELLQRRVRDEAKARVDAEVQRVEGLRTQLTMQADHTQRLEKRLRENEREYETFRTQSRGTPEALLREETARLRAQLGECRADIERERRIRSESELEKEHFRAQMNRLALALKRERERSAASARQDLEQLRLEFLAREERYVLDGDRQELSNIRHELAGLRLAVMAPPVTIPDSATTATAASPTPVPLPAHTTTPVSASTYAPVRAPDPAPSAAGTCGLSAAASAAALRAQLHQLTASGLYPDTTHEPALVHLRAELSRAEEVERGGGRGGGGAGGGSIGTILAVAGNAFR